MDKAYYDYDDDDEEEDDDGNGDDGDDEDEDSLFTSDSEFELRDVKSASFSVIRGDSSAPLPTVCQSNNAEPLIVQSKCEFKRQCRKPTPVKSLLSPGPLVNSLGETFNLG